MSDNKLTIKCNYIPRPILSGCELPVELWLSEFDYYDTREEFESSSYFKYKGQYYDLSDIMRVDHIEGWNGIVNYTYFSGILIRLDDTGESVIVAYYYS